MSDDLSRDAAEEQALVPSQLVSEPSEDESFELASLSPLARAELHSRNRPSVDHLEPATGVDPSTGEVLPLFQVGDRVVVERCSELLESKMWLDTDVYVVTSIDYDAHTFRAVGEGPFCSRQSSFGYDHPGSRVLLCEKKGDPFSESYRARVSKRTSNSKARKGRKKKS